MCVLSDPKLGFLIEELRKHRNEIEANDKKSPPQSGKVKVRFKIYSFATKLEEILIYLYPINVMRSNV